MFVCLFFIALTFGGGGRSYFEFWFNDGPNIEHYYENWGLYVI